MKNLNNYIALFLIFVLSFSCSKKGQKVDTNISVTSFIGGDTFNGGVMIWGKGPDDKKLAISLLSENDAKEMLLDSGAWTFYATGWTGANQIEGTMSCALTDMDLSPQNSNVNLSMSAANCNSSAFAPPSFIDGNEFNPIKLIICHSVSGILSGENCDGANEGTAKSFRFKFKSIDEEDNEVAGLTSVCIDEAGASSSTQTAIKIPVGNELNSLFEVKIEAYSSLSCSGDKHIFDFPNGLLSASSETLVFGDGSITEIFLQSPVEAPVLGSYSDVAAIYNQNTSIPSNSVTSSGGTITSYAIVPALPSGLSMSASTGEIFGTPASIAPLTTYTVTATGATGLTATTNLDITVLDELPIITGYTNPTATYLSNNMITDNSPSLAGGSVAAFSISPGLPSGLSFNTSTGIISGTPTLTTGNLSYTITATNAGGIATALINIEVVSPGILSFDSASSHDFGSLVTGTVSTPLSITVTNTGGFLVTSMSEVGLAAPFSFSGGVYPGTGGNCSVSLMPGGTCDLVIDYTPTVTGLLTDTLDISYNNGAVATNITRALQGIGVDSAFLVISESDPYDFGSVTNGAISEHTFTVSNTGGFSASSLGDITLSGSYGYKGGTFPGTSGTCATTLLAGNNCTVVVEFHPVSSGPHTESINISYNNGQTTVNSMRDLNGTGLTPALLTFLDGASFDFPIGEVFETLPSSDQGTWDANTNSPPLTDGVGTTGFYYKVDTAGLINLGSGEQAFAVNDLVVYSGTTWVKRQAPHVKQLTINNSGETVAASLTDVFLSTPFRYTGGYFPGDGGNCDGGVPASGSCIIEVEAIPTALPIATSALDIGYSDGANLQNTTINLSVKGGTIISIASSSDAKCVVFNNGDVKCWGGNTYGQLGRSNTDAIGDGAGEMGNFLNVVQLGTGFKAKQITGGNNHFCALFRNGSVKCWGNNDIGQLGLDDLISRGDDPGEMGDSLPTVDLGTGLTAKHITAGYDTTCVILNDDNVKCWGQNGNGQLGLGDTGHRGGGPSEMGDNLLITNLGSGMTAKSISTGSTHTCAILSDDSTKCWGRGMYGALGSGSTSNIGVSGGQMGDSLSPLDLGGGQDAKLLTTGPNHTCSILTNDTLKCWGNNPQGQLGLEDTATRGHTAPTVVSSLPPVSLNGTPSQIITTLANEVCALMGTVVKCWGDGTFGGLGNGATANIGDGVGEMGVSLATLDFGTGRTVTKLFPQTTCALLDNNELKCWGKNTAGQLGLGDTNNRGDNAGEMGDSLPAVDLR